MPGPVEPGTQAAAIATQAAAQNAVQGALEHPAAQAVMGTTAGVAATVPGALGVTAGQNVGFAALGNIATQTPELPGIAWLTTFAYQGTKHSRFVNQDRDKWFLLPLIAFLFGFALFMLTTHGDVLAAVAQALKNCGLAAVNAATNYATVKPLALFSSAAEMQTSAQATTP